MAVAWEENYLNYWHAGPQTSSLRRGIEPVVLSFDDDIAAVDHIAYAQLFVASGGAVHVFARNGTQWVSSATIARPTGVSSFGDSLAASASSVTVSAISASDGSSRLLVYTAPYWIMTSDVLLDGPVEDLLALPTGELVVAVNGMVSVVESDGREVPGGLIAAVGAGAFAVVHADGSVATYRRAGAWSPEFEFTVPGKPVAVAGGDGVLAIATGDEVHMYAFDQHGKWVSIGPMRFPCDTSSRVGVDSFKRVHAICDGLGQKSSYLIVSRRSLPSVTVMNVTIFVIIMALLGVVLYSDDDADDAPPRKDNEEPLL